MRKPSGSPHNLISRRSLLRSLALPAIVLPLGSRLHSPSLRAAEAEGRSALESEPQGWEDLLPPADLKGWTRVPVPPGAPLGRAQWHVDSGKRLLICDGDGGHDMLLKDEDIGDAIFHFECCYTKLDTSPAPRYNSGAYVRNSPDGAVWHQAQFGSASGGFLFGATMDNGAKKGFNVSKTVKAHRVKEAGDWNTIEITAKGRTLTLWINGAVTCQFDGCGVEKGRLGLEGEGYRIEFRNLKLKRLK